jgi:3-dehydroquinate synthase
MVDSSVGGKTGIDHPRGKNLLGAFHQPVGVVADLELLGTLPRREQLSGLAEVVKAALVGDRELFEILEARGAGLLDNRAALAEAIFRAASLKARVVRADEREAGQRALLNLGHTLGHALEVTSGYGTWTHGEAVAAGLAFAACLSERQGVLDLGTRRRIVALLEQMKYPVQFSGVAVEKVVESMQFDKKSKGGAPRWVLLCGIGAAKWGVEVPLERVAALLRESE